MEGLETLQLLTLIHDLRRKPIPTCNRTTEKETLKLERQKRQNNQLNNSSPIVCC